MRTHEIQASHQTDASNVETMSPEDVCYWMAEAKDHLRQLAAYAEEMRETGRGFHVSSPWQTADVIRALSAAVLSTYRGAK